MSYFFKRDWNRSRNWIALPLALVFGCWFATDVWADDKAVLDAINAGVKTEAEFETVHKFIIGDPADAKWRQINWHRDLWEARVESVKQGKPLFIWAMNGDPLGCV